MIGMKISKKGVDVKKAGDADYLLHSEFPVLQIYKEKEFDISNYNTDLTGFTFCEHNLDYIPFFMIFFQKADFGETPSEAKYTSLVAPGVTQYVAIDNQKLFVRDGIEWRWKGKYYIFLNKLEDNFTSKIYSKKTSTEQRTYKRKKDYGLKISKKGIDVKKASLLDTNITSSVGVQPIHKIESGNFGGGTITISHNLGYEPMFFCYSQIDSYNDKAYQLIFNASDASVSVDTEKVTMAHGYPGKYSIIIFKDPIL